MEPYEAIDVRAVEEKYKIYCQAKGVEPTRGGLLGWLNSEKGSVRNEGRKERLIRALQQVVKKEKGPPQEYVPQQEPEKMETGD